MQRRASSVSSTSSSAPTITPSLFTRINDQADATTATMPTVSPPISDTIHYPSSRERGPFSAKTGEGILDVFEYIARHDGSMG
ncbi:hypothetical protein OG21DRAFT_1518038 [Imleria badia]|nr:hypothetical protein OG21DRAFT_1518038 [Imleria badia]